MLRTLWSFKTREHVMNNCLLLQRYRVLNIFPESVNISAFSIFSLSSGRKLVAYLNSSQNFHLKNVFIYQGVMPTSKVTTRLAIVSICECDAV